MGNIKNEKIKCACGCGEEFLKYDKYKRERKFVSGHNGRKYEDPTQHKREWNHRNRKKRYEYKKLYHRKRKVKLLNLFGNTCVSCGVKYNGKNACIFHFHHTDPNTKKFDVGNQVVNKAWKTIVEEANKCDLLCANCHEMRHSEEF